MKELVARAGADPTDDEDFRFLLVVQLLNALVTTTAGPWIATHPRVSHPLG